MEIQNKDPYRVNKEHKVDVSQNLPEDLLWKPAKQVRLFFEINIIILIGW